MCESALKMVAYRNWWTLPLRVSFIIGQPKHFEHLDFKGLTKALRVTKPTKYAQNMEASVGPLKN